ncbi:MAG: hypothetical protein N2504_01520 [candidate division WOR-3 bacterium]|nr:hypothetical protein [candidate division WOR-3 bacterium]MCX7947249.1 hypothetical protein [candidate division WOR-3 bacterium]MDW8150194.1 hypothetical protein [candidate division WOR-3 bacterium]
MAELENNISKFVLEKLPSISDEWRKTINTILPWLFIIFGAFSSFMLISTLIGGAFVPYLFSFALYLYFISIIYLISSIATFIAGILMLRKQYLGWRLAFIFNLLNIAIGIISFNILSIIMSTISIYLLSQIRSFYLG